MAGLPVVYDLLHPSPPTLKHFACTTVALDLCVREIKRHLRSDDSFRVNVHDLQKKTFLQCLTSHVPSTLISKIARYATGLSRDISGWFGHHAAILPPKFCIFNHFTDFYCDLNGKIDYAKTGERLLLCDQVSDEAKFEVACWYCLENDILALWPKVSQSFSEDEFTLSDHPELYYWVKRLNNRLGEIALDEETSSVEEVILKALYDRVYFWKWPSVEYLLNRVNPNVRIRFMLKMFEKNDDGWYINIGSNDDRKDIFYRYFLRKLDKETLRHLVATRGDELIISSGSSLSSCTTSVWDYIKDEMTADVFCGLVKYIFREQCDSCFDWCEIWLTAPSHLKRSAISDVLQDNSLLDNYGWDAAAAIDLNAIGFCYYHKACSFSRHKVASVLIMILSDAAVECRRKFWIRNWRTLMSNVRIGDFRAMVNLCLDGDQSQITQFKIDAISSNYELIIELSSGLLRENHFRDLEDFLTFWHANDTLFAIRDIRSKLLRNNCTCLWMVRNACLLNEFIDKAYSEVELAAKFKNSFLLSSDVIDVMVDSLQCSNFREVMEFIDVFIPSQAIATQVKEEKVVPKVVLWLHTHDIFLLQIHYDYKNRFSCDIETFLNWLLKTDDSITRFKKMLDINEIVDRIVKRKNTIPEALSESSYLNICLRRCFRRSQRSEVPLKTFLRWYFVTPENFDEFANKYADNEIFVRLMF